MEARVLRGVEDSDLREPACAGFPRSRDGDAAGRRSAGARRARSSTRPRRRASRRRPRRPRREVGAWWIGKRSRSRRLRSRALAALVLPSVAATASAAPARATTRATRRADDPARRASREPRPTAPGPGRRTPHSRQYSCPGDDLRRNEDSRSSARLRASARGRRLCDRPPARRAEARSQQEGRAADAGRRPRAEAARFRRGARRSRGCALRWRRALRSARRRGRR